MTVRRRTLARVSAGTLGVVLAVVSVSVSAIAGQQGARKLDKDQKEDAKTLGQLLDRAQAGQQVPTDVPVAIESYNYLKAGNGTTYVPVTMAIDTASLSNSAVSVAIRVVRKDSVAAPAAQRQTSTTPAADAGISSMQARHEEDQARAQKEKAAALEPATYQDVYFADVRSSAGRPGRFTRAFQAAGGEYDMYVAVKERVPADKKKPKMGVCRQALSFPDFSKPGELTLSSTIWLERADEVKTQLDADQQRDRPYAIGAIEIVPAVGTKFAKAGRLQVFFQIYNYTLVEANKPDVIVEYNFYRKGEGAEQFFNRTEPDVLNAARVSPVFDGTRHQLSAGFDVDAKSFPAGDYRLEIKVTDKPSGKSVTRNLEFSVV